ncbi:MAG: type II CAAX endopeptidase family protein [Candidatus Korobacteraceae bacterium]
MPDPELTPAPSGNSQLRIIFIGPHGVRAGWRLLVFFALLVAVRFAVVFPLGKIIGNLGTDFSARKVIIGELFGFGIVLAATAIMGRFEHRSLADYGLPFRFVLGKQFWAGALWGFVMLSVIVGMMAASGAYSFGSLALSPADVLKYALLWALAFLLVGFFEEFSFRGYLQYTLTSGMGFWPAAGITCVIFAGLHLSNPGENWMGAVEIVLIALFLCLALRRTGNLWFAIGWHMAFDWGESFFYSTPNSGIHATGHMLKASLMGSKWLSGGTVGPEASVFDLVVTVAGILLLAKIYPEARYPVVAAAESSPEPAANVLPQASPSHLMP